MNNLEKYKDKVYRIIGAAMTVHTELGGGLLEPIYNEALHLELLDRGIENEPEKTLNCYYKGHKLEKYYRMDIVAEDIIIELKATDDILPEHRLQLFNYMRLTKMPIGLLLNFGIKSMYGERYYYDPITNECHLLDKSLNPYK
jgi:GxxExxY protein